MLISSSSGTYEIIGQHASGGDAKGTLDVEDGTPRFLITTSGGLVVHYAGSTIPTDTWTHLAAVYDGSYMRIYINGTESGSPSSQSGNITSSNVRSTRSAFWGNTFARSSGSRSAGRYQAQWDGRDDVGRVASTGIYLYRLISGERMASQKLVLLK